MLAAGTAYASQATSNYTIPLDVIDAGGADVSKSNNYLLTDSIGEPIVGLGVSANYILNSGYRQPSAADFLSVSCPSLVAIGTVAATGQKTGSGACNVYTDAYNGYQLTWSVLSGSGGVNTGYLISEFNDTIAPFNYSRSGSVVHWRMDETSAGSTVRDYSGNGNGATPNGAGGGNNKPQPSTNVPSNMNFPDTRSLDFDGTDDYLVATVNGFATTNTATISAWVKMDAAGAFDGIVETRSVSLQGLLLSSAAGNPVTFSWEATGDEYGASTGLFLGTEEWYFIAVAVSPTSATIYRVTTTGSVASFTLNKSYNAKALNGSSWYAGEDPGQPGRYWDGSLDEVRIYKRTLSLREIKALASQTQPWSVGSADAAWGARLSSRSTDTHAKWGTDGSDEKWLNIGPGSYSVVSRNSATTQSGSTEIIQFRGEVGSAVVQTPGVYRTTATFTVLSY